MISLLETVGDELLQISDDGARDFFQPQSCRPNLKGPTKGGQGNNVKMISVHKLFVLWYETLPQMVHEGTIISLHCNVNNLTSKQGNVECN